MAEKKIRNFLAAEKKLKEIWDILRNKQVVRFTLSARLYRDDSSVPETISMQGERFAEGGWNTSFPVDQISGGLESPETLKGKLERIEENVRQYIAANGLDADWIKPKAKLEEALKSGLCVEDLEYSSEAPIPAIAAYGYDAHLYAPIMATAYAKEGGEALEKNSLDRASHCVDRGLHWSSSDMFIPNPKDRFKERASAGGLGKDRRREPIKDKVAELLVTLAPAEGWDSTSAAIESVTLALTNNHSSFVEGCQLVTHNLPTTIDGWVRAEPERFSHRIKSKT